MRPVVLICALKQECPVDFFNSAHIPIFTLKSLQSGQIKTAKTHPVIVIISGVGQENATQTASIITTQLDPLFGLNFGSCATLTPNIKRGDILQINTFLTESGPIHSQMMPFDISENDHNTPIANHHNANITAVLTSNKTLSERATVIDMEASYQAAVFHKLAIPFYSLKIVSDFNDTHTQVDFQDSLKKIPHQFRQFFQPIFAPKTPKISVIIPTFNRESTLKRAIDSVINQDNPADEIIIVDDGSTDATSPLLEAYSNKIKHIKNPHRKGVSHARNLGIKHAQNPYIALLDSDDYWTRTKLKNQIQVLQKNPYLTMIQSEETWLRNGKEITQKDYQQKQSGWLFNYALERCVISPSSALFKKSVFSQLGGFDERLPACEDYDLWLKWTYQYPIGLSTNNDMVKTAGHTQLSTSFARLDHFRVIGLIKLLIQHPNLHTDTAIQNAINTRLKVLKKGAEKRGKKALCALYAELEKKNLPTKLKLWIENAYEYNPQEFE